MKFKTVLLFLLMVVFLSGCGSDSGSSAGTVPGEPEPDPTYIGDLNCLSCHHDQEREWLKAHGNLDRETLTHNPSYPLPDASCDACHDRWSLGDPGAEGRGWTLTGSDGPVRPVVSCEACHGAGGFHFGMGPLPRPVPGVDTCVVCHNDSVPDNPEHGSAYIAEDYLGSKHAANTAMEGRETISAHCAMCHSDEGFINYSRAYNFDGDLQRNNIGYALLNDLFAERAAYSAEDLSPVSCRTCHKPHSGELRAPESRDPVTEEVIYSREFNTCTSCHQVFVDHDETQDVPYFLDPDIYGGEFGLDWSDPANTGRLEYHNPLANPYGNESNIIANSHFRGWFPRLNEDGSVDQIYVPGYYIGGDGLNPGAENSCTVCHDAHSVAMGWIPID